MDLTKLSAIQIGKLVNSKEIRPIEVIEHFIKQIENKNDTINAIVDLHVEEAIREAHHIENCIRNGDNVGPLAGVPILFKDFLSSKPGWIHSFGGVTSVMEYDDYPSRVYAASRNLGMISLGKTNSPNFGFAGTCDNKKYGPTKNPFNIEYNSGGSSGGSAAAVASGMGIIAEGGDAGGSIRIPASWCNCFGFKPSGTSIDSFIGKPGLQITHPICTDGVITKTVDDSILFTQNMYENTILDTKLVDIKKLRIAVTHDFNLFHTDKEICKIIDNVASMLKSEVKHVDYVDFKFNYSAEEFADMWCTSLCVGTALDIDTWKNEGLDILKDHANELSPEFIYWNMKAAESTVFDFELWYKMKKDIELAYNEVFNRYDVIISPVTCCMPVKNSHNGNTRGPNNISNNVIGFTETFLTNFLGLPSASVPSGFGSNGLPVGIQLTSKLYDDITVMAISKLLEQLNPWNYDNIVV